jgi:hypothetical protein
MEGMYLHMKITHCHGKCILWVGTIKLQEIGRSWWQCEPGELKISRSMELDPCSRVQEVQCPKQRDNLSSYIHAVLILANYNS